jgi:hypothetical protein
MGHPITNDETELINDMIIYYKNHKKNLILDLIQFIIVSVLLFNLILLLFQN